MHRKSKIAKEARHQEEIISICSGVEEVMQYDMKTHPATLLILNESNPPYFVSSILEDFLCTVENDEDVIFFDGGEACTAYKRVDCRVKPVVSVARAERRARKRRGRPHRASRTSPRLRLRTNEAVSSAGRKPRKMRRMKT